MIGSFRTRAARRLGALLTAAGLLLAGGVVVTTAANAAAVNKVTICHATSSTSNPYVENQPNKSGDVSGHDGHKGPVFSPGMTKGWGDIIPPFSYTEKGKTKTYPGKNWTADGQAIWQNKCKLPKPPVQGSGIEIEKTLITEAPVRPGGLITYSVKVTNTGNTNLYDVVVTDALPSGTTFVQEGSDDRWNAGVSPLTAPIGVLGTGTSTILPLVLKVDDLNTQEWGCSSTFDLVNTATVNGFYPKPTGTVSPSASPYSDTANANPALIEYPDCASITVHKVYDGQEGYQDGWTFTTELPGGTVNGHDGSDSQQTGNGDGHTPASFDLEGYLGEGGKDVTITETQQDGWNLDSVVCYLPSVDVIRVAAAVTVDTEVGGEVEGDEAPLVTHEGNVASLKVHPYDHIECTFTNKHIPTTPPSTTPPSTTPPAVTTTPPTEVLGEKESPTPTTSVLGEKLPFTGAPTSTGLILSLVLVAGGALLLFGSTRRDAKHRG